MTRFNQLAPAAGILALGFFSTSCENNQVNVQDKIDQYATVRLTVDTSGLTASERQMIPLLIEAAQHMDPIFWQQTYGNKDSLIASINSPTERQYVAINIGPWDRLNNEEPFIDGVGEKPAGANLYPADLTKQEFEQAQAASAATSEQLRSLYTLVRRGSDGSLTTIPYHEAFADHVKIASDKLREAATLAEDPGLRHYLSLRADALLDDEYRASDLAWMSMKDNTLDIIIGPIETYEDQLFGYKAAYEAYVLIKDKAWSDRLSRFTALLPALQSGLPVAPAYKQEMPGSQSDLNAYDVIYYAGEANTGAKTIAINLPNDETVQLEKGTRRLQLKNTMRAKFDNILVPLANELIAVDQVQNITFDAFFANTMFHEVAHGLGIKNTVNGKGTVRKALKEHASAMEEGKADILGLYMITKLFEDGELTDGDVRDNYVTFMASVFRSVRFGASDAHGKANMVRFNFFKELGAFTRDEASGRYSVDFEKMQQAMVQLSDLILTIQGEGDHEAASKLFVQKGIVGPVLQSDLDRLTRLGVPVDIVFEQGNTF